MTSRAGFGPRANAAGALLLAWETPDPARVRGLLRAVGFVPAPQDSLAVTGLALFVREAAGPDRLRAIDAPEPAAPSRSRGRHPGSTAIRLRAVGLATVDAGRDANGPARGAGGFPGDSLLGASAAGTPDARLILLEPITEGRLASSLARLGEGPVAIYLQMGRAGLERALARLAAGGAAGRDGPGPFGPQHLAWTSPPWGPHVLLLTPRVVAGQFEGDGSATIEP